MITSLMLAAVCALPGFKRTGSDELYPVPSKIAWSVEGQTFRFSAETATPPDGIRKRVAQRPSGAAPHPELDDSYAFAFPKRFVVNARGASNVAVEGLETKSIETNGVWKFDLSVPLSSVGGLPKDGKLKVVRLFTGTDAALGKKAVATLALSAADAPGLSAFELGARQGGHYPVRLAVTNPSAKTRTVRLAYLGRPVNSQPCSIARTLTLKPGATEEVTAQGAVLDDEAIEWTLKLTEDGKTLVDEQGVHRPFYNGLVFAPKAGAADAIGFKFSYFPSYNQLRTRIDGSALSSREGVTISLCGKDGKPIDSWPLIFDAQGVSDMTRMIPDLRPLTVKSGSPDYALVLRTRDGLEVRRTFQRFAMEWEGNKLGLSDAVPWPFEKVKAEKVEVEKRGGEKRWTAEGQVFDCDEVEKVGVVLRDHYVDKRTGLWQQVIAAGKPLLARPMRLVKGHRTDGTNRTDRTNNSIIRLFDYSIIVSSSWDYDGLMMWKLTLPPGHYEPMALEIPIKASEARLMHECADGLRSNYGGVVPAGIGRVWDGTMAKGRREIKGSYIPYLWVGGTLRGISVFGDNDKGWIVGESKSERVKSKSERVKSKSERVKSKSGGDGQRNGDNSAVQPSTFNLQPQSQPSTSNLQPCQEIIREADGTVVIRLNLIQRAVDLTETRTIKLGFMATPVKPMPENWRGLTFGEFFGASLSWGGIGGVEPADGTDAFWRKMSEARKTGKVDKQFLADYLAHFPFLGTPGSSAYQDDFKRQKIHHDSGMNLAARAAKMPDYRAVFYTNARGVEYGLDSGRTYLDEWSRVEWKDRNFGRRERRDYELDPVASYRDYAAWWYRKMFETGACDDMYWDDVYASANWDTVSTDAYRLPDGSIQPSVGIFNMRALIRRCAVVQAELGLKGGANWVHMTNTAMAPICSFAGVNYDMEDITRLGTAFQQMYPKDYLEAVSIGRQFGNRPKAMAYYTKSTPEKNAWYERTGAGIMLCYEIDWMWNMKEYQKLKKMLCEWGYGRPEVRVWNYWNEDEPYPLSIDRADDCASLIMSKRGSGEAIAIVADFSGKGGEFKLKPDAKALGLGDDWEEIDFETGEEADDEIDIRPYDFRIIKFQKEAK